MEFSELGIEVKAGKVRYAIPCPKCNHLRKKHKNAPSLTVNNEVENRWFKCWHCSWSGNLDLMDKYDKVRKESKMPEQFAETFSQEVRDYLKNRGLDQKILLKEKVFEFTMGKRPILGFPFYVNMTLVNVKYFNPRWKEGDDMTKWWQMRKEHGTRAIFLGMQSLSWEPEDKREVLITEGEMDMMTWKQAGYRNVISVPMGAPSEKAKNFEHEFDYAKDKYVQSVLADEENNKLTIIFSTDNDAPGKLLKNQLALIFGKERCKYINYPAGYKDINEVWAGSEKKGLKAMGQEGVDLCYQNQSSFPVKGIISPHDVRDELNAIVVNGFTPGLGIGMPEIDRLFTLKPKHVTFITGIPSVGKSVFIRWYVTELIRHNDKLNLKWGWFTPENRPIGREYAKIAEVITTKNYREGTQNSMSPDLRDRTMRYIEKHIFIISPDRKNFETWGNKITADRVNTMESILKYLEHLKKTEDIFGFVIDAWNKIEHEQPRNMTETSFISQQLDYLINFCDVYDLHGIVIVHPRKIEFHGENYKMPSLYDIKGSSAWKEKADIGIVLHRYINKRIEGVPKTADEDEKYFVNEHAPTILRTEKVRFDEIGKMDRVKLMMECNRGGRFVLWKDDKNNPDPSKLNPAVKEKDDDNEFLNDVILDDKELPF